MNTKIQPATWFENVLEFGVENRKIITVVCLAIAATAVVSRLDIDGGNSLHAVVAHVQAAGPWSLAIYWLLFAAGLLFNIPGALFSLAAFGLWGPFYGWVAAYTGGVIGAIVHLAVYRGVGGVRSGDVSDGGPKLLRRLLVGARNNPMRTTVVVRAFLYLIPPANISLVLAPIPWKTHAVGTAVGLLIPTTGIALSVAFLGFGLA